MRYFKLNHETIAVVPDGADPRDYGVDPRSAVEMDRAPGDFERHVGSSTDVRWSAKLGREISPWRYDQAAHEEATANARLNAMTPAERHEDAIRQAVERMRAEPTTGEAS
jgi:hypothetical protein